MSAKNTGHEWLKRISTLSNAERFFASACRSNQVQREKKNEQKAHHSTIPDHRYQKALTFSPVQWTLELNVVIGFVL